MCNIWRGIWTRNQKSYVQDCFAANLLYDLSCHVSFSISVSSLAKSGPWALSPPKLFYIQKSERDFTYSRKNFTRSRNHRFLLLNSHAFIWCSANICKVISKQTFPTEVVGKVVSIVFVCLLNYMPLKK